MWNVIAAIASTILGLGSGTTNLSNTVNTASDTNANKYIQTACYAPEQNIKLTLKWPTNFTNVPDYRPVLHPGKWGSLPSSFNTNPNCQPMVMDNKTERKFIRVRQNVRLSSCKTDEEAGPYAGTGSNSGCPGVDTADGGRAPRGSCSLDGYTDLRKIAEIKDKDGKPLEIFWNPFSHNVGCNYKSDQANCGVGQRRNVNLKDFIYVLLSRDAFDMQTQSHPGCPVLWDAGSVNKDACSHYFDVYMAEDFYLETQSAPATNDPESKYYFVKQVLENCQEIQQYIPVAEANLTLPPLWIKTPFMSQIDNPSSYSTGKIIPGNDIEKANYLMYIWGRADLLNPFTTNLIKFTENSTSLNVCQSAKPLSAGNLISLSSNFMEPLATSPTQPTPSKVPLTGPTIAPLTDCYDSLGTIYFKDENGKTTGFKTYSKLTAPQTFTLVNADNPDKSYQFTITEKNYPSNLHNDPSLQLRIMRMITLNEWTWATPSCKPAIYMYPEKPEFIGVKLDINGQITVSNPNYDASSGWNVLAMPDGTLKQPINLSDYPYLYYEADIKGITIPKEGWVIERQNIKDQVSKILENIGFNNKEISDFMAYWLPRLTEKPYYFVTLLPEDVINTKEKLSFTINPDTLIRTRVIFEGLDAPKSVAPLSTIPTHQRVGFTVTDWGGTLVGHSCSDVTVK